MVSILVGRTFSYEDVVEEDDKSFDEETTVLGKWPPKCAESVANLIERGK